MTFLVYDISIVSSIVWHCTRALIKLRFTSFKFRYNIVLYGHFVKEKGVKLGQIKPLKCQDQIKILL